METTRMRPQTMATLMVVGAIFGSSFLMVKLLVREASPAQITAWRLLVGGVAVALILSLRGELRRPSSGAVVKATILAMLDSVVPNTLLAWAQIRIDSGIAAVLVSSMPMFTVLFAMALPSRERLSAGAICGLVLGIAGVAVLVGADAHRAASGAPSAHVAVLIGAMAQAAAVIYARRLLARENPLQLSAIKLLTGGIIALLVAAAVDGGEIAPRMDASRWALLIGLGVTSNAVGRTMYLSLIARAGSVRASLVAYIVPAVGVLLGWLVLGERLGASGVAGLVLIAGGMSLVTHGEQIGGLARRLRDSALAGAPSLPTRKASGTTVVPSSGGSVMRRRGGA